MTAVNKDAIYSDVFKVMYYNVSGILAGSLMGIFSFFPDTDFPGYPICTIESADVGFGRVTMGRSYASEQGIDVGISLYSKSMQNLDELSGKLISGLMASDKSANGTYASGLCHFNIESSPTSTDVMGTDRVHSKAFGVSYVSR